MKNGGNMLKLTPMLSELWTKKKKYIYIYIGEKNIGEKKFMARDQGMLFRFCNKRFG